MKDKRGITITNAFQILDEANRKPDEKLVDIGSKFYNILMKSWLQDDDIEMYSTSNDLTKENLLLLKDVLEP